MDIGQKDPVIGTGFLVASNLVLTVAHNLFCRTDKLQMNNAYFFPGLADVADNKKGYKIIDYRLTNEYHLATLNLYGKKKK